MICACGHVDEIHEPECQDEDCNCPHFEAADDDVDEI